MDNDNQGKQERDAEFLYQSAQQSAEHHDAMLWEVTYIVWGSTTLLLGFVLEAINEEPLLSLITAGFSIFITVLSVFFAMSFRKIRNNKYAVCKRIEQDMNMKWKQHSELDTPIGTQTRWYCATAIALILVWLCVVFRSLYSLGWI